jgi:hypothetical protein
VTFERSGWRLLALAGFSILALSFFSFTIDDAYIALRYARNLAAGLGPTFDAQPPREGYSSPLWIALAALPFLFHLSADAAVVAVKGSGLALGVLAVALTAAFVRRTTHDASAANAAALLLACTPWMAFWSVGGLETPLYCALLMGSLLVHERETQAGRAHVFSAVLLALLSLTRPEGIVVALFILLADPLMVAVRRDAGLGAMLTRVAPALLIVCAVAGLHEAWRIGYYGSPLPSTFQAKAGLTPHDLKTRIVELVPFAISIAPLILAAAWARSPQLGLTNAAWGAGAALAAFIFVPRLEGGPGYRYEVPLLPLLAAAAAAGLAAGARRGRIRPGFGRPVMILSLFLLTPIFWLRPPAQYSPSAVEIAFGRWLAAYAPDTRLAVYDLGAVPYFSAAPWVIDTNPAGPLHPFLGRAYDVDALLAWSPSFIVLPPEPARAAVGQLASVYSRPAFKRDYVLLFDLVADDGYRMWIWKRRDVRLLEGALPAAAATGLYQRRVSRSTGGKPKYE